MECGFCGTSIKDGYDTCSGCGATYRANEKMLKFGARRVVLGLFSAAFGALFVFVMYSGSPRSDFNPNPGIGFIVFLVSLLPLVWGFRTLSKANEDLQWHKSL